MPWAAEVIRDAQRFVFVLRVDGWPRWFSTQHDLLTGSWAPPGGVLFRPGLESFGPIAQSADPFDGWARAKNVSFKIIDVPDAGQTEPFLLTDALGSTEARAIAEDSAGTAFSTFLTASVAPNATQVTLANITNIPGLPFTLHVGIEAMRVDSVAAGTTYNVTRRRFPHVDGVTLGLRHDVGDGASPQYLVSNLPVHWYRRWVALYGVWVQGNLLLPNIADAQLLWSGRIVGTDYEEPNVWTIDCSVALEELARPVLADLPVRANRILRGIDLRRSLADASAAVEEISVEYIRRTAAGAVAFAVSQIETIAASRYPSHAALLDAVNDALSNVVIVEVGQDAPSFWFDSIGTFHSHLEEDATIRIEISARLAFLIGWGDGSSPTVIRVVNDTGADADFEEAAPESAIAAFVSRHTTAVRVNSSTDFLTQQTTGTPAWIEVGAGLFFPIDDIIGDDLQVDRDYLQRRLDGPDGEVLTRQEYAAAASALDDIRVRHVMLLRDVPLDLMRLMLSTGTGTNGVYDQLPRGYGLGIPQQLVDVAAWERLVDQARQEVVMFVRPGDSFHEVLDGFARALGFYVVMRNGLISVRPAQALLPGASTVVLRENNKAAPEDEIEWNQSAANVWNAVEVEHNYNYATDEFQTTKHDIADSITRYESRRVVTFRVRAWRDIFPVLQTYFLDRLYFFSQPQPRLTRSISRDLFTRLVPGDVVLVNDGDAPDPQRGRRGLASRAATVVAVKEDWMKGRGEVTFILDSSGPTALQTPLAPSAEITAFDPATFIATLAANEFTVAPTVDRDYFTSGDVVLAVEGDPSNPAAVVTVQRTISSIGPGANQVTLSGGIAPLDPAAGPVYLTFAARAVVTTDQTDEGTWVADADDNLIQNTNPAHLWR